MSRFTVSQRKFGFSIFASAIVLLSVASIAFGTIGSSAANFNQILEALTDGGRFDFLSHSAPNFFKKNNVGQRGEAVNVGLNEGEEILSPNATFQVNSTGDSNDAAPGNGVCADSAGRCTLRAAIQEANATAGIDEISLNFLTGTAIQLDSSISPAELAINEAVTITGSGARLITVSGNSKTILGVFNISAAATATTTIRGISVADSQGNGIRNEGKLNLSDVVIKGNRTGIYNTGKLDISRALINGNTNGGGIYITASSVANISNTTVTGNASSDFGGGIFTSSGNLTLNNVTISGNTAATSGGGLYYSGSAAGVYVRNTIVANNTAPTGTDIFAANGSTGGIFTSRGNNLIGKSDVNAGFINNANGDKVGTSAAPVNPLLGPLQNNGGQIDTLALLAGSPAKDAGNACVTNSSCPLNNPATDLSTDQRGTSFPRLYESGVEIGAFESFYPVPAIGSLAPNSRTGGGAFELTVNGSNFVADSVVKWNGQSKATTFVSNTELKAHISAADTQTAGQYPVTVVNPQPGGGSSNSTNFAVTSCSYSLNPASQNFTAGGGNGSTSVTTASGCAWTATTSASWITITAGNSGTGPGTVSFMVAQNVGLARTGTITIGGQTFTVNQPSGCAYAISPNSANSPAGGGAGSFNVTTSSGACTWSATSKANWITVNNASGTGSGTINYTVAANTGPARTGSINVNGLTFTVTQANGCAYTVSQSVLNVPAGGGNASVNVTAGAGCAWTAQSNHPWITITAGATGSGNGTVTIPAAANTGPQRTGTIVVAVLTIAVSQPPGCILTITPACQNFNATDGTASFAVAASDSTCAWNATTSDSWITITGGSNGTGNGTVTFSVAANTGPERSGTITVGGRTFTVTQNNGCTYSISPPNITVPAGGATGTFNVITGAGCVWTAATTASWITITAGSGNGNGTVSFSVAANSGPPRSGTITVGGQTFTVNQNSGCTFSISPTSASVPNTGGTGSVTVTASNSACQWSAVSNISWITITAGASGTGNGIVTYSVAANTGPQRTGTVTIGGQTFTVTQDSGCTYAISPTGASVSEAGGNGSFNITTEVGCPWTAVSNASWITITSGAGGTGSGTISYSVAANSGSSRTGTISVGGQTFTVNQISLKVTNLNDNGAGSLRQAVINANNSPGNDVITFQAGLEGGLILTSGEIAIANNGTLEIRGPGADVLAISGSGTSRIFYINNAAVVSITDVTLTGGNGVGSVDSGISGGAIYANESSLRLNRVFVNGNATASANGKGAGVYLYGGSNHSIRNSTFFNNRSAYGAALFSQAGEVTITNSTFSGNVAQKEGGGIYSIGSTTLRNVTITENRSVSSGSAGPKGAGITVWGGILNLANTIVAGNNGPEISFSLGEVRSAGNNLIGDSAGDSTDTGNPITYEPTDILNTPPQLGVLEMYGGSTPTRALMPRSPAINAGNNAIIAPTTTDQRGSLRIVGDTVDIGAFEYNIAISPAATALSDAILEQPYSNAVSASRLDGINPNEQFKFQIVDGFLPTGLEISQGGIISGIPTAAGFYTFTVKATGTDGMAGAKKYTILVGCSYQINPTNQSFSASGGSAIINVIALPGCPWTATPNVAWITVGSGASGTGNGTFSFTVQPNTGAARTGFITVAGQIFTVTQSPACIFSLSPPSMIVPAGGATGTFNISPGMGCGAWTATTIDSWITITAGTSGSGNGTVSFSVASNTGTARTGTIKVGGQTFIINQVGGQTCSTCGRTKYDFDGDGRADVSVFRPENGVWYLLNSTSGFTGSQFGVSTDKIVPADYDGDGKTDVAVYRDGTWYLQRSQLGFTGITFGAATDIPAPADYDGDGKADIAVFRPSNGTWYVFNLVTNQFTGSAFGQTGDIPVAGDYDADGKADIAVYRPSQGTWYIQRSQLGFTGMQFGTPTDKPVPADYDGDGKTDIAVFRPESGTWYLMRSTQGFTGMQFGLGTDKPAPADYDGDGKADIAVFRSGTWYLQQSTQGFTGVSFGASNDQPVPNAFVP